MKNMVATLAVSSQTILQCVDRMAAQISAYVELSDQKRSTLDQVLGFQAQQASPGWMGRFLKTVVGLQPLSGVEMADVALAL